MKETMQQHLHTVGQKAIQNVIRHEYGDWPPKSGGLYYQPHRPEKPLPKPQDKKQISRCSSKPVASQMRRAFSLNIVEFYRERGIHARGFFVGEKIASALHR